VVPVYRCGALGVLEPAHPRVLLRLCARERSAPLRASVDLVDHYGGEMSLNYLRVRYEDRVDDQEVSIRRVLDFIGEEFDPKCFAFH